MRHLLIFLTAVSLLLLAAAQVQPADKVGVVDLQKVFEGYKKREARQEDLKKLKATLEEKLAVLQKQITPIKEELELLEKGTSRYLELEKQAFSLTQESNYELKRFEEEFTNTKLRFHEQIFGEIRAALARYAVEHGYRVVLQKEFSLPENAAVPSWESVLYNDAQSDLTDALLAVLNKE